VGAGESVKSDAMVNGEEPLKDSFAQRKKSEKKYNFAGKGIRVPSPFREERPKEGRRDYFYLSRIGWEGVGSEKPSSNLSGGVLTGP